MGWLNPLTWIKLLGLIKGILDFCAAAYQAVRTVLQRRRQAKADEQLKHANVAVEDAKQAKTPEEAFDAQDRIVDNKF